MNSLYTLCAFAIGAVCAVKLLKQFRTDLGTLLSAAAGIVITASLVSLLVPVIELLESFSRSAGLENYFPILLKFDQSIDFGISPRGVDDYVEIPAADIEIAFFGLGHQRHR